MRGRVFSPRRPLLFALPLVAALWIAPACAAQDNAPPFGEWLTELRAEAAAAGISEGILAGALDGVAPLPRVVELDRRQPEGVLSAADYLRRVVPAQRVETARARLETHRVLLEEVAARYRVQPRFIVALWGIETDFGRRTGTYNVIAALATLAHDRRRSAFFRAELLAALRILEDGHIAPGAMFGSWAGAMGQCQFMPTSFTAYAVDYDGDGRRDIWGTLPDVFASIANYLANAGWRDDQTWGRGVLLPDGFDDGLIGRKTVKPIGDWQALGVRRLGGADLPARQLPASILRPDGPGAAAYMVYGNFRAARRWNPSDKFALAVGLLADRLAAP